jgi:hypothetical protein
LGKFLESHFYNISSPPQPTYSSHPTHRYIIENPVDVEGAKRKKGKGKAGDISEEGGKGKDEDTLGLSSAVNNVDFLCKRIAFCFNKFESAKRVHSWAKDIDDEEREVLDRLQKVLTKFLLGGLGGGGKISYPKVKIVKARLTESQEAVYKAYAHSFLSGKSTSVIANGLMKLRSLCLSVYDNGAAPGTLNFYRGSDKDSDLADAMESKSGKMAALGSLVEGLVGKGKKVVVLASLPAALTQASMFLNAIGVKHDVLIDRGGSSGDFGCGGYIAGQRKLEEFEEGGRKDVIVASVASVSGIQGGIIPTTADSVVILDEDWSGRQDAQMANFIKRILLEGTKLEITRIVTEGTIESVLFGDKVNSAEYDVGSGENEEVKLDYTGCIISACNRKTREVELILGRNIWGLRGKTLDEVLSFEKPKAGRGGGGEGGGDDKKESSNSQLEFLPLVSDSRQNESVNRAIGGQLSVLESRAAPLSSAYKQTYGGIGGGLRAGAASHIEYLPAVVSFNGSAPPLGGNNDNEGVESLLEALSYNASNGKVEHVPNCTVVSAPNVATFPPFAVSRMDSADMDLRKYASAMFATGNLEEGGEDGDEEGLRRYYDKVNESWAEAGLGCSDDNKAVRLLTYPVKEREGKGDHVFAQR